ncbi:unnamed protein product [Thelazia callipaeda]|uniref:RRM domain-containing protein n=1 Tax=Thelazia callipaeda TaxID=103827 RepID=A0A0N5D7K2_THECL|nr:unnamed protein product [Thelazia callipaeda]
MTGKSEQLEVSVEQDNERPELITVNKEKDPDLSNFIRLRGLPFSAKEDDVRTFLQGLEVKSVTFTLTSMGRASGECYVELLDKAAAEEAKRFDKEEMNNRYIEVFSVTENEVAWMTRHNVIRKGDEEVPYNFVVRLRGIPFSATDNDVKEFFDGLEVADVVIDKEPGGRPSGEAFVRFASKQHAEMALERNRNNMGSRYVEVFRSSGDELEKSKDCHFLPLASLRSLTVERNFPVSRCEPIPLRFANMKLSSIRPYRREEYVGPLRNVSIGRPRVSPYDVFRGRFLRYSEYRFERDLDYDDPTKIYLRGLPYTANALDIEDFFKPLRCIEIQLGFNDDRRPSGDACVIFGSIADAHEAMAKNKHCIGNRYIELFTALDVPIAQKYVIYRKIGGTSEYPLLSNIGSRVPAALSRINCGPYDDWNDCNLGIGRHSGFQRRLSSFSRIGCLVKASECCGVESWCDSDLGRNCSAGYNGIAGGYSSSYAAGGQQFYNDEYEGRQSSYAYHWNGSSGSVKAGW